MSDYELKGGALKALEQHIKEQRSILSDTELPHDKMLRLQGHIQGVTAAVRIISDVYKGLHS